MHIDFSHNERTTMGVEMELHLVDPDTGQLVSAANEILDVMGVGHPATGHPKAKHELFQSTVEVITGICETPAEARADLLATLDELRSVADARGVALMSGATHPFGLARTQDISPDPRYHRLVEAMQWPARRMLICGMHVHVGVPDGEQAIAVLGELMRHLPVFLALSTNSPFFEGDDTGMSSARSLVFESMPTAGLPPQISNWSDFEYFMSTLIEARCIETVREVWWDVRPHPEFGTVEIRMCDAVPTVRETIALAALGQTLVQWCLDRIADGTLPPAPLEWTVKQNRWEAARRGRSGELIVETPDGRTTARKPVSVVVHDLLETLQPTAERLGTTCELDDVAAILDHGTGTDRQRRLVERGGTLLDVVHQLVDEFARDIPTPG